MAKHLNNIIHLVTYIFFIFKEGIFFKEMNDWMNEWLNEWIVLV